MNLVVVKIVFVLVASLSHDVIAKNMDSSSKIRELFPEDCGMPRIGQDATMSRIVNGDNAPFGKYPWHVMLNYEYGAFLCSGVLINKEWILTAAHCVKNQDNLMLRFGEHDKSLKTEPLETVPRTVKKMFVHPKFVYYDTFHYDVALIKLSSPLKLKPHIQPICLPNAREDETLVGKFAKLSGWGRIYDLERNAEILQEASLPIVSNKNCRRISERRGYKYRIYEGSLCAGFGEGKISACNGDSGGPLQMRRENGRWFVIGIVSWSPKPCAAGDSLDVFSRVSFFVPWIRRVLFENYEV